MPSQSTQFYVNQFARGKVIFVVVVAIGLSANLGCQSLHPFAKKTQQSLISARQWARGGMDALHNGRLEQAKGFFSHATEQNPHDPSVRANFARTLFESGDRQKAIAQMRQAVDLSPGDTRLVVELGEMYLETGDLGSADHQVELAMNQNRRFAPAWALSGKTAKAKTNYKKALADFQRALGLSSDLPDVEMEIVDTYQQLGESFRALSAVEQILNKHPSDDQPEPAVLAKSIALMDLDQIAPAIDLLQTASLKQNASSAIFVRLGQAQLLAGQVSEAGMTLERGKQSFPNLVIFDNLLNDLHSAEPRVASTTNLLR